MRPRFQGWQDYCLTIGHHKRTDPAIQGGQAAAAFTFAAIASTVIGLFCWWLILTFRVATVLGVITGWVGVRRSRGYPELPWAGLALNSALLLFQLTMPLVLLAVSEPGANWGVAPMIAIVATVFAALAGAREFVMRAKPMNDPAPSGWRLWWVWVLGVACGTGVMGCILGLLR
jgi:hypothetical protein